MSLCQTLNFYKSEFPYSCLLSHDVLAHTDFYLFLKKSCQLNQVTGTLIQNICNIKKILFMVILCWQPDQWFINEHSIK